MIQIAIDKVFQPIQFCPKTRNLDFVLILKKNKKYKLRAGSFQFFDKIGSDRIDSWIEIGTLQGLLA